MEDCRFRFGVSGARIGDLPSAVDNRIHLDPRWPVCYHIPMAGRLQTGLAAPGRAAGGGCARETAESNFLSVDLVRVAGRLLWWVSPEEALDDPMRLVAQVMSLGSWDDVVTVERVWGEEAFRAVLDAAPPGLFTARRWNYWHVRLGRLPAPPLPRRSFA